jgi:hypothetical protein
VVVLVAMVLLVHIAGFHTVALESHTVLADPLLVMLVVAVVDLDHQVGLLEEQHQVVVAMVVVGTALHPTALQAV